MWYLKGLLAWLAATLLTAAAGSIVQTQFNLAAIAALGTPVPFAVRLGATLHDLRGFAPVFAAIAAGGFLLAFLVAALLSRWWPKRRTLLYTLAGVAAIATAVLIMNALLPVTPIAATRTLTGLLALCACGAAGGYLFTLLAPRPPQPGTA